ncbi:hypothetical protein V8E36_004271 [Tilletia maclaganii]
MSATWDTFTRYHHAHNLSSDSTSSTSTSISSGAGSDTSTPPSSAHTHSHSPFKGWSKRPMTSSDGLSKSPPPTLSSPRSGFFRHKGHTETQTSTSSAGSSTLVSVDMTRSASAGTAPTSAPFNLSNFTNGSLLHQHHQQQQQQYIHTHIQLPSQQQQPQQQQTWFHRHTLNKHEELSGENDDALSDASFGCGLATEFDRHVDMLKSHQPGGAESFRGSSGVFGFPHTNSSTTGAAAAAIPPPPPMTEPVLAAAWKAKMSQADERQIWLDTVFFRLKARAEGASQEELHELKAISGSSGRRTPSGSGGSLLPPQENAGSITMERKDSAGADSILSLYNHKGTGSSPTSASSGPGTTAGAAGMGMAASGGGGGTNGNMDSFLDFSGLINPCPPPGTVYVSKYAAERAAAAAAAAASKKGSGVARKMQSVPTLTPKASSLSLNKLSPTKPSVGGQGNTHFADFIFPPPPEWAVDASAISPTSKVGPLPLLSFGNGGSGGGGSTPMMNTTPKAPPMQRFASSDQVLHKGRTSSSSALRQTALANAAAANAGAGLTHGLGQAAMMGRSSSHQGQQQHQQPAYHQIQLQQLHHLHQLHQPPVVQVHSHQAQSLSRNSQLHRTGSGGRSALPSTTTGTENLAPVTTRPRSQSDAARRSRTATHGRGGSGGSAHADAAPFTVPTLPDWAKQANRSLHQSKLSGSSSSGGDAPAAVLRVMNGYPNIDSHNPILHHQHSSGGGGGVGRQPLSLPPDEPLPAPPPPKQPQGLMSQLRISVGRNHHHPSSSSALLKQQTLGGPGTELPYFTNAINAEL